MLWRSNQKELNAEITAHHNSKNVYKTRDFKAASKREQSQVYLNYAEREQTREE